MAHTIDATEARVHLGEVLRQVSEDQTSVVIERTGQPELVAIPVSEFALLQSMELPEDDWWTLAEQAREHIARHLGNRPMPPIDEIIQEMREERDAELLADLS